MEHIDKINRLALRIDKIIQEEHATGGDVLQIFLALLPRDWDLSELNEFLNLLRAQYPLIQKGIVEPIKVGEKNG